MSDTLCSICFTHPYKYTCPACSMKTCCLECIKRHKKQNDCSGTVEASKFITKKELGETPLHINRDYNFLMRVGRTISASKEDVKTNAKNMFKRGNNSNYNRNNKRLKVDASDQRLDMVYKSFGATTSTIIKRQNTMVILLPDGMSRATSNKTGYDKKSQNFSWTIQWIFQHHDINKDFLSYRVNETIPLRDSVPLNILQGLCPGIEKHALKFYLKNPLKTSKTETFIELEADQLVGDNLKDTVVLEYPTIIIRLQPLQPLVTIDKAYVAESRDDSDDDSDTSDASDTSSSDSDSSDGNDSNAESSDEESSDDNDPPEEHTSKIP